MQKHIDLGHSIPRVCRLGLATRGNTHPQSDDVLYALERGINYWNWCGHDDGMSQAVRQLGPQRRDVVLATQLSAAGWTRDEMWREIAGALNTLRTDYLDVATLYYVESRGEWDEIVSSAGSIHALQEAREQGVLRAIGLTTHQRGLAAQWVQTQLLDTLMIRYNGAHRGAEQDVFPITDRMGVPTICFTCLRWGALQKPTPADPPDFTIPTARAWYRFVLSNPSVAVALMAPNDRAQLEENLRLLDDWQPVSPEERRELCGHGDRVRDSAGPFP